VTGLNGCKKCCISSEGDGTGDDVLLNGSGGDGNGRGECAEGEGTGN
jgi:hypothetical protein